MTNGFTLTSKLVELDRAVKEGTREIDKVDEQGDKGGGESDN
jgi:hypothetical protein